MAAGAQKGQLSAWISCYWYWTSWILAADPIYYYIIFIFIPFLLGSVKYYSQQLYHAVELILKRIYIKKLIILNPSSNQSPSEVLMLLLQGPAEKMKVLKCQKYSAANCSAGMWYPQLKPGHQMRSDTSTGRLDALEIGAYNIQVYNIEIFIWNPRHGALLLLKEWFANVFLMVYFSVREHLRGILLIFTFQWHTVAFLLNACCLFGWET